MVVGCAWLYGIAST